MHLAALYGLWAHHYISGQPAAMLEMANEFLAFAEREEETDLIMVGYRLVGTSRLINGYIADASDALHQAFARYDPAGHGAASPVGRSLRARFGQDVGVTMYSYRSWRCGCPASLRMQRRLRKVSWNEVTPWSTTITHGSMPYGMPG